MLSGLDGLLVSPAAGAVRALEKADAETSAETSRRHLLQARNPDQETL
jgi:hypothetical protein